ncbi:glycoside hydrolase family 13 protein [Favolaschia claudopus]|uniref:alpha-amylase n=1 Tax=Favolaschia claudopus TaxID=2862362 RepID=A0AAW0EJV1_9AGAR
MYTQTQYIPSRLLARAQGSRSCHKKGRTRDFFQRAQVALVRPPSTPLGDSRLATMLPLALALLLALTPVSPALAASASEWASKSIYQLVTDRFATSTNSSTPCDTSQRTYCGGSWAGITQHLDYIQDMGFDAVWISPISKNLDGTAYGDGYHGYWLTDLDTTSSRFGTAQDLKNLSAALHARGMYLMLDVVVNHFAALPQNSSSSSLLSTASKTSLTSPLGDLLDISINFPDLLPLSKEADFHPACFIADYTNQTEVEQCWLGDEKLPLPDVNTEDPDVVETLYKWIADMVKEYGVDGVRIDTVKHIRRAFWEGFTQRAGVFTLGEVETDNATYAASYLGAVDGVLDYPTWYKLIMAFASVSGNLSAIQDAPSLPSLASPPSSSPSSKSQPILTGSFLENHDQPRFPSFTHDVALRKNAMVWTFVGDGLPIVYYGQEQGYEGGGDPSNREALWLSGYKSDKPGVALLKTLNGVRKQAIKANESFLATPARWITQTEPSTIMLSKPPLLTLFTNVGANDSTYQPTWRIPAGLYAPGTTLIDVLACRAVAVGSGGNETSAVGGVVSEAEGAGKDAAREKKKRDGGASAEGETLVKAKNGMPQVLIPASMLSRSGDGVCPALATGPGGGAGREGTGAASMQSRVGRGLAVVGALGVVALL